MSIRTRILMLAVIIGIVPIAFLAMIFRVEMTELLTEQYGHRADALLAVIESELHRRTARISTGLAALSVAIRDDNRFRRAAAGDEEERYYLLDYASLSKNLIGFDMLQIQDEEGRIISSGHYRNEFDRLEPDLPALLARMGDEGVLIEARQPEGSFLALARVDSFTLGRERFYLVGGFEVNNSFLGSLVPDGDMTAALLVPGRTIVSNGNEISCLIEDEGDEDPKGMEIRREFPIPMIGRGGRLEGVQLVVHHHGGPLGILLHRLDRWFRVAVGIAGGGAFLLALWMSIRVSRPIRQLARQAAAIDLDRLDARFEDRRRDEVGTLSRLLGEMTARLRASALRLRESERRATLGEMARQVNHDLRNGLTPIRNVFRHLAQVGREEPEQLTAIFEERQGTIDSGLNYLEDLSQNYSRLSRKGARCPCNLNRVVHDLVSALSGGEEIRFVTELDDELPPMLAEMTGLRRIVENLVANGIESLPSGRGVIVVQTDRATDNEGGAVVQLRVKDNGIGMDAEKRERIFDHFYTDKDGGTGLGLSIVRRLVTDYEGTIDVKSRVRQGTLFVVTFPAAPGGPFEEEC